MIPPKRILVPTDFSETSNVALKYAMSLAHAFSASLHVLHVVKKAAFETPGATGDWTPPLGLLEELQGGALDELRKVVEREAPQAYAEPIVRTGSPFVEIVQCAKEMKIDLIVMGTHGRGPVAHMLMGSVAEKVVRKAPCPVLTVRHPEHAFVMP